MDGNNRIIERLNELLTIELTAINQYFVHGKMCENWGYDRLAAKFRATSLAEMTDAEEIMQRILFLQGVPNLQRLGPVAVGETPMEQLALALESERGAVNHLREDIAICIEEKDDATRVFLEPKIADEESHIDWAETQLQLIKRLGEQNYLSQQIRE